MQQTLPLRSRCLRHPLGSEPDESSRRITCKSIRINICYGFNRVERAAESIHGTIDVVHIIKIHIVTTRRQFGKACVDDLARHLLLHCSTIHRAGTSGMV